jgi:hypothetical protein
MSLQFPATNLLGCNQVRHVYLCDKTGILDKRLDQSCLGTLYNQQFDIASTLCPMKIINAKEIIYQLDNNKHLVYSPIGQTILINCPGKSSEKFLQRGVSEFKLEPGCKTSLLHHYVFANKSIAMDSGLEHITLPRETQMVIPRLTSHNLESHLQIMKTHGQYRPTVNDLIEAQQQSEDLSTKVEGDHLIQKQFVLSLLLDALGTSMGTLTDKKYECLQESLTTTNIMQKKLIEVVKYQEKSIHQITKQLHKFATMLDYTTVLNPANMETT